MSGAEVRQAALAVADDIWNAAQWMGDALAGEFAHKRTVGQIVVDAVISMIPVAGEITAARDCVAITLRLSEKPEAREDRWEWVSLVLCLLAVVPVLGGILKGVGKLLIRAALKSEDLVQLGREILAFLRKMGYGDAHEWLQKLDFAKYQTEVVKGFNEMLSRLGRGAEFVTGSMRAYLPFVVWLFLKELPPKLEEVRQLGGRMIPQGIKDLNSLLDRVRQKLVEGTWADITIGTDGARVMTEEARLVEMAKDMGVSLGHKAADVTHYEHHAGWPNLKDEKFERAPPIPTFSVRAPIEAITQAPGSNMVRVVDTGELHKPWTIPGRFWTTYLPANGSAWRSKCAIKHYWNMNGSYAEIMVPTIQELQAVGIPVPADWKGMRVWKGLIAEQIDNEGNTVQATMRLLVGGDVQYFVDFDHVHNLPVKQWIQSQVQAKRTSWSDVQLPHQKEAKALLLAAREHSLKVSREGYALRGTATLSKQNVDHGAQ